MDRSFFNPVDEDDLYSGFNEYPSVFSTNDLQEDEEFLHALRTSYEKRPTLLARPGIATRLGTPSGYRQGTSLVSSRGHTRHSRGGDGGTRPMTAVHGAGYTSSASMFDPSSHATKGASSVDSKLEDSVDSSEPVLRNWPDKSSEVDAKSQIRHQVPGDDMGKPEECAGRPFSYESHKSVSPEPGCSYRPTETPNECMESYVVHHVAHEVCRRDDSTNNEASSTHSPAFVTDNEIKSPRGRRYFDVEYLFRSLKELGSHRPFGCGISDMDVVKENRKGFFSTFILKCSACGIISKLHTECPSKEDMDINTAMVSSMICTGQGYAQLAEMSAILNIPPMANQTFLNTQANLASAIHDVAWEEMKKAAMEESELAIKANEVDKDGIPLITVVCDGSWAKRSYCTNYNSLSGVACIVGFRSKKVIFIGVRNKYCCICSQAISKDPTTEARPHVCFKNWNSSSTAMEADIIAEGFKNSVTMYNLKYNRLLGDGDSSIMQRLGRVIPYGIDLPVQKVECSNHLLRNYCNRIREVVKKPNNWKGHVPATIRKNVGDNLPRLRNAVSSAIKFQKNAPTPDSASLQY